MDPIGSVILDFAFLVLHMHLFSRMIYCKNEYDFWTRFQLQRMLMATEENIDNSLYFFVYLDLAINERTAKN